MRMVCSHQFRPAVLVPGKQWYALAMFCALAAGCRKPVADAPVESATPTPPRSVAAATPTSQPPAPAQATPGTPAPPELAPPGVYYLLGKASIVTTNGIIGLRPGTQVQKTGAKEYTTTDGQKLTLAPNQVTNDLRVARQVISAATAEQNALARLTKSQVATPWPVTPSTPPSATASRPAAPATPPRAAPSPLGSKGALGASHSRVQDGYYWERDANGNWRRTKPVR